MNNNDDESFIAGLRKEFCDEVSFFLEQSEESYLLLEQPENRAEELTKIFRVVHNIKGTSAAVGFVDLCNFAHEVENCLTLLRARPESVTSQIISVLLKVGDLLKRYIGKLRVEILNSNGASSSAESEKLKPELKEMELLKTDVTYVVKIIEDEIMNPGSTSEHIETISRDAPGIADLHASEHEVNSDTIKGIKSPENKPENKNVTLPFDNRSKNGPGAPAAGMMKIDPVRLDVVLDLVGELVILKGQLMQERTTSERHNLRENEIVDLLDKTIRELQDKTLSLRLTSLRPLFMRVQRIVRDVSMNLNKMVEFTMLGTELEIDRSIIDSLTDPLVHIARNAIDHGIEVPNVRQSLGKNQKASVVMDCKQTGGRIVLEFRDDGRGISREGVIKKALEKGLISSDEAQSLSEQEVYALLFLPGFSTTEKVTDLSGRGVGLDVVKSSVEKIKGMVEIESEPGRGTTFRISVPLTTAITDGIIVLVQGRRFVIPTSSINELVQIGSQSVIKLSNGQTAVIVRDRSLPLVDLKEVMKTLSLFEEVKSQPGMDILNEHDLDRNLILVIQYMGNAIALRIDGVIGQNQVVVKPLDERFKGIPGIAGAAILGDGNVALVLDTDNLARAVKRLRSHHNYVTEANKEPITQADSPAQIPVQIKVA